MLAPLSAVVWIIKSFNGFTLKTKVDNLQQVRILPRNRHIVIEVVYNYEAKELKEDNDLFI